MRIVSELCVASEFGVSCTKEFVKSNALVYLFCAIVFRIVQKDVKDSFELIRQIDVNYLED